MAEELYHRINKQNILAVFAPDVPYCLGADGSQLKTRCRALISFNMGPFPIQHSFLVLSKLRHQAILGSDFLEDKQCNVDFPNRKLRFVNGGDVDLHRPNKRIGQDARGHEARPASCPYPEEQETSDVQETGRRNTPYVVVPHCSPYVHQICP